MCISTLKGSKWILVFPLFPLPQMLHLVLHLKYLTVDRKAGRTNTGTDPYSAEAAKRRKAGMEPFLCLSQKEKQQKSGPEEDTGEQAGNRKRNMINRFLLKYSSPKQLILQDPCHPRRHYHQDPHQPEIPKRKFHIFIHADPRQAHRHIRNGPGKGNARCHTAG